MRILLVAYYYPPIISGGSQRPSRLAKYLAKLGHAVTVLAPAGTKALSPAEGMIRIQDPSHNMDRGGIRGLQWLFLRLAVECLNRLGCYASIYSLWRRRALRLADAIWRQAQPEVIVATYPPVETLEIGLHLSRQYRVPLVADFRDGLLFEPVEAKRMGRFTCIRRRYERIEAEVAGRAAAIVTISPHLSAYFQKTYGLKTVSIIPNGFDPDELADIPAATALVPGVVHIVHTGKIALSDPALSLRPLISALELLLAGDRDMARKMHLHLVGKLSAREARSLSALRQRGIVSLHGEKERRFALAMQRDCDLLLLMPPSARPGIAPGKLFEYLAMRKPILALGDRTYSSEILREIRSGYAVPAHDPEQIAAALKRIVLDKEFRASLVPDAEGVLAYSAPSQTREWNAILQGVMPKEQGRR